MRDIDTETMGLSDDLRVEEPAIDTDALAAAASVLVDAQHGGAFVSSFEMTPRDLTIALGLTSTQLSQLQAECDPSDDIVHGWRRVRGRKGSRVRLWERGSASSLTHTGIEGSRLRKVLRRRSTGSETKRTPRTEREPAQSPSSLPVPEKDIYAVRSSITVHAPLAAVMKTLDCSMVTSYRSFTKIMYENLVTDTSMLSYQRVGSLSDPVDPTPTHLAESVAVRWLVCKCSSPLVSDCDLSLVEYTKVHTIDDFIAAGDAPTNNQSDTDEIDVTEPQPSEGLRVREKLPAAYKILRSMETRHCPVLSDAPHYLERVNVPLGGYLLYRTDNDDITDVVFFMSASYERKKVSTNTAFLTSDDRQFRAIQQVLHRMALGIGRIPNAVDAYTMSLQLESLKLTQWIENSHRSECVVCFHRFHPITRRRHHCRLCGDVICRDCSIHKDADLPTIGPTTLRICKLCDVQYFGRSTVLATIATDVKRMGGISAFQHREMALETTTFDSPTVLRQRYRRQTEVNMETSKSSSKSGSPHATVHTIRRHSVETPMSCPKPTVVPPRGIAERWANQNNPDTVPAATPPSMVSPGGKWSKAFFATRAAAASPVPPTSSRQSARIPTNRSSPMQSPSARFAQTMPMPHSTSKDAHSPSVSSSQRFNFGFMKAAMASPHGPRKISISELSLDSPADQYKTAPLYYGTTPPRHLTRGSSLYSRDHSKSGSENQSGESDRRSSQRDSSFLGLRARLDQIDLYEDLLLDMCERASEIADSKYAALSIFTSQNPTKSSDGSALTMVHYLKVRGSAKLMRIAPNLQCCEPIIRAVRPIVTRNALTFKHDVCDFANLPFVKGPQQARFYAGVPLVDSQERFVGALAVFDAQLLDEDDEVLQCPVLLESIARSTMARIEARRSDKTLETFMNAPLLRQSERSAIAHRGLDDRDDIVPSADDEHLQSMHMPRRMTTAMSYAAYSSMHSSSKNSALNYYKQQMHRLVQQANKTQDQVMQNAYMHGVSY